MFAEHGIKFDVLKKWIKFFYTVHYVKPDFPWSDGVAGGGGRAAWRDPLITRKIGLSSLRSPPLFWPKHADFVIFTQFLAIMPNLSPHQ